MSKFTVKLREPSSCHIKHELAGSEIVTDRPPEYGGKGRSFSSTDLVTAALGSCVLSSIHSIVENEGYDPYKIRINITKQLNQSMIESIKIDITYPEILREELIVKLKEIVLSSPVKLSLNEKIKIRLSICNIKQKT